MTKEKKFKQDRKLWFKIFKHILKIRYKKPEFHFLGEKVSSGAIILSNHEGTDAPLSLEIYSKFPIRMWGTGEMNSGLIKLYKYQTKVYYHEKKHWNLFGARMFCLIASPLTNIFYKGLNLISTFEDARLVGTIRQSVKSIQKGENVVIFPEKSDKGYLKTLEGFHNGFVLLAEMCEKRNIDVPIYTAYYKKDEKIYVFDKPIYFSELRREGLTREQIAEKLVNSCNRIGALSKEEMIKLEQEYLESCEIEQEEFKQSASVGQ